MQTRNLFLFSLLIICIYSQNIGGECSKKAILDSSYEFKNSIYDDHKSAFNEVASCASLRTDSLDTYCCYIKVKFKNKTADKKFTHRGCTVISQTQFNDMDQTIDDYEEKISNYYSNNQDEEYQLEKVDVHIDCGSKYIKLAGLILLAFLF